MASSSASWHEPYELLPAPSKDMHRTVVSLMEELEALDWYAASTLDGQVGAHVLTPNGVCVLGTP